MISYLVLSISLLFATCALQADDVVTQSPSDIKSAGISWQKNSCSASVAIAHRVEAFYGRSLRTFNTPLDEIIYTQGTWDIKIGARVGDFFELKTDWRNKSRWGNPNSIARTSDSVSVELGVVSKAHRHFIGKQIFWMREGWADINLNNTFGIIHDGVHHLRMGAFPFVVGRGIALGDAYAVSPGLLGFYSESIIDQYAFGFQWYGDIQPKVLGYDLYLGLLSNKADSFVEVNERIYGKRIGNADHAISQFDSASNEFTTVMVGDERGFAHVNYVAAARLRWTPLSSACGTLNIEPYVVYNHDPEQVVEFNADANSKLGTIGIACEYTGDRIEWGIETAGNFGRQEVFAWDRNLLNRDLNDNGQIVIVNSKVLETDLSLPVEKQSAKKALQTKANADAITKAGLIVPFDSKGNTIDGVSNLIREGDAAAGITRLENAPDRFRNGYKNTYHGWMIVADMGWWLIKDRLQWLVSGMFASGDENPNNDPLLESEQDSRYNGFIGLQEVYSGKRIQSVVYMNGGYSLPRPLSRPLDNINRLQGRTPSPLSGFTNLISFGTGLKINSQANAGKMRWSLKPSMLLFWQDSPSLRARGGDLPARISRGCSCDGSCTTSIALPDGVTMLCGQNLASRFLGTEFNLFADIKFLNNLDGFIVAGMFIPGERYKDLEGLSLESIGGGSLTRARLGRKPAYTLNFGLKYTF